MKLLNKIFRFAKKQYVEYNYKQDYDYCAAVFRQRLVKNGIPADEPAEGEDAYIHFWQQFHRRVEPYTYRYFHTLLGTDPRITPEDLANRYIAPLLNPIRFRAYYSDKNMYRHYIKPMESLPQSWLYRIMGGRMYCRSNDVWDTVPFDISAEQLAVKIDSSVMKLVLKPSIDSNSGRGVMLFERIDETFTSSVGHLSGKFLCSYGDNWILQEAIDQHEYLKQFSKTSINTMRIMTYRSVIDDSAMVFAACLRIGLNGSFVDNLFAGGCFVPIDLKTGRLGKKLFNRYWQTITEINGIDFLKSDFVLPFWGQAVEFAKSIALQVPHARLIAQDILIDDNGNPRLIEFNVNDFDWALAMTCTKNVPFGDKFEEVIEFCLKHKNSI